MARRAAQKEERKDQDYMTENFIYAANEARIEGNWIMLAPYGEFPHSQGAQVLSQKDAEELANEYERMLGIPRFKLGVPIYIGHPDHPKFAAKYTDSTVFGRVKKLEARAEGLFANVRWNDRGRQLIRDEEYACASVNWPMTKDEAGKWRPVGIKSVGLTNEPNLPVEAITLANEFMDKTKLLELLGLAADSPQDKIDSALTELKSKLKTLLGIGEDSTDAQIVAAVKAAKPAIANMANEKEVLAANERVKSANRRAAVVLIANGMRDGKILPYQKDQWERDFANEFDAAANKLETARKVVKTEFIATNLGQRNAKGSERQSQITEFVNERMQERGELYPVAYRKVMAAHPELFTNAE